MAKQSPPVPFDMLSPREQADVLLQTSLQALASSPALVEQLKQSRRDQHRQANTILFPRKASRS